MTGKILFIAKEISVMLMVIGNIFIFTVKKN